MTVTPSPPPKPRRDVTYNIASKYVQETFWVETVHRQVADNNFTELDVIANMQQSPREDSFVDDPELFEEAGPLDSRFIHSNYVPSNLELSQLGARIEEGEQKLRQYDETLAVLRERVANLE
ncbi:hypothetical protein V5O48_019372, partial [Marasmius crinis-equi]